MKRIGLVLEPLPYGRGSDRAATVRERCPHCLAYLLLFLCAPAFAAVTGTVVNRTTGQPAAAATVGFYKFGQGGMERVDQAKTDAQGRFSIDREPEGQGPSMLRVEIDGVTYNHMLPPGTPATCIEMAVFSASATPGAAKVGKHMIMLQPAGAQMAVSETYLVENSGKTTWFDPKAGTLRFYLPAAAKGNVEVHASAPDGMSVPVPSEKTSRADVYAAKFEVKPGETRFDLSYTVPYTEGALYAGKIVTQDSDSYLIVPKGVTLTGENLSDLGEEPRTQAHIYGFSGTAYQVTLAGTAAAPAPNAAADASGDQPDSGGPHIEPIMPRINAQAGIIMALALAILALGFVLLYRRAPGVPKTPVGSPSE